METIWFNDTRARKCNENEQRVIEGRGARDKIIPVHFDGKSAGNTFHYRINAQ